VGAAVTAMGVLAMPELLRRKYDPALATGTIRAAGTLGILSPPSILTIVYAVPAQVSIGKLLIAGIMPGLILASIYILYLLFVAYFQKGRIPPGSGESVPMRRKLASLKAVIIPMLLIVLILGSIFFGVATPTEAAAVGVVGAIGASALRGKLRLSSLGEAGYQTLRVTAMILWITIGAKAYVAIFTGLGGADTLMN